MSVFTNRTVALIASVLVATTMFVAPASAAGTQTAHLSWQGDPTVAQVGPFGILQPVGQIMLGNGKGDFVPTTYAFVCVKRVSGSGTVQYQANIGDSPRFGPFAEFVPTTAGTSSEQWLYVGLDKPYTGSPSIFVEQRGTGKGQVLKFDFYGYGPNSAWVTNPCA
jgi:hypothetical protein